MLRRKHIVFLRGGLGNQMFQYAFYLAKKVRGERVICDSSFISLFPEHNGLELERVFGIKVSHSNNCYCFITRVLYKLRILRFFGLSLVIDKRPTVYLPEVADIPSKNGFIFYLGCWQSEKYFECIKEYVRGVFSFDESMLSFQCRDVLYEIRKSNSISIHIRRGDYLDSEYKELFSKICTIGYYNKAIGYMQEKVVEPHFFVFSTDISWVEENIEIPNVFFVDCNHGNDAWQDMYLMSQCKHNVIANSTFSWWGAWLNTNQDKIVVSPPYFLNTEKHSDIVPDSWITI